MSVTSSYRNGYSGSGNGYSGTGYSGYHSDHSASTPSPVQHKDLQNPDQYDRCMYHHGKYCCSKICTIVVLLLFTTCAGLTMASLSLWLDNWAGISTNPYATLDLPYPRLGTNHLDYVMFNKTIPNDAGTLYKYIDESENDARFMTSRYGLLSHCKSPVQGPKIALFQTPWKAPVCKASFEQYQCPIVAMRTAINSEPRQPKALAFRGQIDGCIPSAKRCDGAIDCPTGHDELNCPQSSQPTPCSAGMVQCSANKHICISKSKVCNGINDCGMYEDEQNCCGRVGFLRCEDGSCVMGERCDAKADCFDLSDEYDCPTPSSNFYAKCDDGQLIDSTYKCERKEYASFQCRDLSDETDCLFDPMPLQSNPAMKSLVFDEQGKCFKTSFTFARLDDATLAHIYPDPKQREFHQTYEYSIMKQLIIVALGVGGLLSVVAIVLLVCIGNVLKRCKLMRRIFIALAFFYLICIIQTLITGVYWTKYVRALNDVITDPTSSNMYEQVAIETVQVTGGLASIRISTQLTFYNCGFFGLAFILSIIAAHILKNASCHTQGGIPYSTTTSDYKRNMYSDDPLMHDRLLMDRRSDDNSTDNGMSTPNQVVYPQQISVKSLDGHIIHSQSESALRSTMPRYYSHNGGTNTYISYNDFDSVDKASTISRGAPLTVCTLDRGTVKSTQV